MRPQLAHCWAPQWHRPQHPHGASVYGSSMCWVSPICSRNLSGITAPSPFARYAKLGCVCDMGHRGYCGTAGIAPPGSVGRWPRGAYRRRGPSSALPGCPLSGEVRSSQRRTIRNGCALDRIGQTGYGLSSPLDTALASPVVLALHTPYARILAADHTGCTIFPRRSVLSIPDGRNKQHNAK